MHNQFRPGFTSGRLAAMLALTLAAGIAMGAGDVASLQTAWPGASVHREAASGITTVYGTPMEAGATPEAAAAAWLQAWGHIFEAGELELTLEETTPVRGGRFTAFLYSQTVDGLPVDGGLARILVRSAVGDAGAGEVVLASGRLAPRPGGAFPVIRTAPEDVIGAAQRLPAFAHDPSCSASSTKLQTLLHGRSLPRHLLPSPLSRSVPPKSQLQGAGRLQSRSEGADIRGKGRNSPQMSGDL